MSTRLFFPSVLFAAVATILVFTLINLSFAQVRTSPNYQLQSDSINIGGGFSSSTNYVQESTVGEIATGPSNSSSYRLRAGYQQMQEVFMSLAVSNSDFTLTPALGGLTGGTSNGSTTFTAINDSPAGYQLTIEAENDPAMQAGAFTIADYNEGAEPDYVFTIGDADAHLGYTPEGVDITQPFLNVGVTCNTGGNDDPLACWAGLSTTADVIAEGSGPNQPNGATTTVHFRVGIGGDAGVAAGEYTATTTVTALPL